MPLLRRRDPRIGRRSQWRHPGLSACRACETSWANVEHHITDYTDVSGCFPLCELCWAERTPAERLPYYRQLWCLWLSQTSDPAHYHDVVAKWPLIERAVLAGL